MTQHGTEAQRDPSKSHRFADPVPFILNSGDKAEQHSDRDHCFDRQMHCRQSRQELTDARCLNDQDNTEYRRQRIQYERCKHRDDKYNRRGRTSCVVNSFLYVQSCGKNEKCFEREPGLTAQSQYSAYCSRKQQNIQSAVGIHTGHAACKKYEELGSGVKMNKRL